MIVMLRFRLVMGIRLIVSNLQLILRVFRTAWQCKTTLTMQVRVGPLIAALMVTTLLTCLNRQTIMVTSFHLSLFALIIAT